ncbi:YceI family protein [Paraherbaspirillum soli]|uniref:YceI family protein n=1 Tax=Paraherbaspirillum soli TaxID=631222 RepID=A0ABW0MBY1_9BURK
MMKSLVHLLLLLSISIPGLAAERFDIDPQHTWSIFEYRNWGLSLQRGRFDRNAGFIELDQQTKTGVIDIEVDAASISTGLELLNKILRSADFFDVDHHPKISFKSSRLHFDQERLVQAEGELTIKGITRPTTLEVTHFDCHSTATGGKPACAADGFAKISRSDFKLGHFTPFVSDGVTLYFSVEGVKN